MKKPYMPHQHGPYILWHDNLKDTATATVPGVTATDVTTMATDNGDLHTKQSAADKADAAAISAHNALNQSIAASQQHARVMVKNVKNNPGYTTVQGDLMKIEGAEDSTDMTQEAPVLTVVVKPNGVNEVGFNKKHAQAVRLHSQLDGEPVFSHLADVLHSPYVDNRPLAVAGKPETRRYWAEFLMNKGVIGLPSAVVVATAQP